MSFKLGEEVHVVMLGKITEIRMVGDKVKYTVCGSGWSMAYVSEDDLVKIKKGDKK